MSIADDLRASMCAGCIRYEQPRTEYCDRCGNDEFVGPVAELEAIVRELGECDPKTSGEIDTWCFFCEADERFLGKFDGRLEFEMKHEPDCLWLRAREVLK